MNTNPTLISTMDQKLVEMCLKFEKHMSVQQQQSHLYFYKNLAGYVSI